MDRNEPTVKQHSNEGPLHTSLNNFANFLRKPGMRITGAAAAATLALTLVGCGVSANAEGPAPSPTSSSSESPNPTETEAPAEASDNMGAFENDTAVTPENAAERLAELQFTADMTPEQLGEHYNDVTSRWTMAGATPETWEKWYNDSTGLTIEDIAFEIAAANAPIYATALYGENYANIISPTRLEEDTKKNAENIMRFINTFGTEESPNTPENVEAWNSHTNALGVEVTQQSDTHTAVILRRELQSNSEQNMFADEAAESGWNGYRSDIALTFAPAVNDANVRVVIAEQSVEAQ